MVSRQNNIAFYLKYRPQSLDELVGQDHIKTTLLNAFAKKQLSHAYLFVGPRGTGKTSCARILAKMVNCREENVPCNKCATCLSITDGSNLDLIEIDAASNRGIEDIRTLREKIKLSPSTAKKKVYIIDESQMLTTEAFNALLKTLEEPPSHALFILATTDAAKLPPTILSRVQRLDFRLATEQPLMETLKKIVMMEKIDIDETALKLLIKRSEGSFRDGVKLLDQVSANQGKISVDTLEKFFISANFDTVLGLLEVFVKKDTTASLALILKEVEEGVDIKEFILSLMDVLRNLLFIKNGLGDSLVKDSLPEENYQSLVKVAEDFAQKDLVFNLDVLQRALEKLKVTSIPSLPLELAIIEICAQSVPVQSNRQIATSSLDKLGTPHNDKRVDSVNDDVKKLKEKWTYVCETIRPFNFSLEALLRSTNIKECTDTTIIMEVPYSFHQRIIEAPKNRDLLEGILSDILGRGIHISTVLGNRTPKVEDIANIEVAADDEIIRAAAEIFNSDSIN